MSACAARRCRAAWPSGRLRSRARLRLLRLKAAKKPAAKPPSPRVWSPRGAGSILITSAPRSANTRPQVGPITVWLNSRTFSPAKGRADISARPCLGGLAAEGVEAAGVDQFARELVADDGLGEATHLDELVEIDAGADAHFLAQQHQFLGADVAGRALLAGE